MGNARGEQGNGALVIKTDANGVEQWHIECCPETQESGSCYGSSIAVLPDGDLAIAGKKSTYNDYGEGPTYGFVILTDENGNEGWSHVFEDEYLNHVFSDVELTSNGGLVLTGGSNLPLLPTYYFLAKLDSEGTELWWKELNIGELDVSWSVVETTDGGFLVAGASLLSEGIHWSIFIDKTDSEGNLEWRKIYDNENSQVALAARETRDGGYIIVGYRSSQTDGSNDVLLMKTDAEGNL